ncbi:MAG: hypothetical protein JO340_16120 [Acidobacteriaceae bacterium]|nr:hypothetical protein [Acidobacteriaceae bacterium]
MASKIHEQYGRLAKAVRLSDVLDALHISSAAAAELKKPSWELFARIAGVPTPGVESQALTVKLLQERENLRAWVARSVMEGLPPQQTAA